MAMKKAALIDAEGYYIEDVVGNDLEGREDLVFDPVPQPCMTPRWNGIEWVEEGTLDLIARSKINGKRDIDDAREQAIAAGFKHDFNGSVDTVQMRKQDRANITGLVVQAQMRRDAGDETQIQFRAESDETYQLTPEDVIALGVAAQGHISMQYERAWALKDQIDAAQSADELAEIHWPE